MAAFCTCEDGPELACLYDGSLEGLLSAVFWAYEAHQNPTEVVDERVFQPRLGQRTVPVATDYERALRVRRGVERAVGPAAFSAIARAAACDDYGAGTTVYRFIRYAMARPASMRSVPVLDELANPRVQSLVELARRTSNECERMRQFIRFSHLENGVWFARCNPGASVVPFVMGHFAARLNDQPFIIYDEAHQLAGVHHDGSWSLVAGEIALPASPTAHDREMEEAWKRFYDALLVDARYNPELRRAFMPMRLWRNLAELQPRN